MAPQPHAYARIVSIRFRPETIDLARDRFRDVSAPLVRVQEGSLGILGAADRASGRTYAISFWRTSDDLERSNANPQVVEALTGYAAWMTSPFAVESFAVVSGALPAAGRSVAESARLTAVSAGPDTIDDVIATFDRRLARVEASFPECAGSVILRQLVGFRGIAVELWTSRDALVESDLDAQLEERRMVRDGILPGPITHDLLEVFGRY